MRKRIIGSKFIETIGPDGIETFCTYVGIFSTSGLLFVNEAKNADFTLS
jgi:hypothetical protein